MFFNSNRKVGREYLIVTGFVKRGLIHAFNFATLMSHNFVCDYKLLH